MHPVLVLSSTSLPTKANTTVTFLPMVSLRSQELEHVCQALRQSSTTSPSPPPSVTSSSTPGNSPSYILLDQSWDVYSDLKPAISPESTLFPSVELAPLSLRVPSKLFILIDHAWAIESSCPTPYPPHQSSSARGKALPNPSMFLAPESLEWVVALHVQKLTVATPILRGIYGRSSCSTVRSGCSSEWIMLRTVKSDVTRLSEGSESVKGRKSSVLNAAAKDFVALIQENVEKKVGIGQEGYIKESVSSIIKVKEEIEIKQAREVEKEEPLLKHLEDPTARKVGQTENEDSLHEQWGALAFRLVKDLMTMDNFKAMQQQDGESSHEKSSDVVCRRKSKFFEAKSPLFNVEKSSTAFMTEVFGVDYKERFIGTNRLLLQRRIPHRQSSRKRWGHRSRLVTSGETGATFIPNGP
jgi:hypothetical protein